MAGTLYLLCIVAVIVFDQLTKYFAVKLLMPIPTFPIIENVIHFTYVENRGAAFGILQDQRWVFMVFSTLVMLIIVFVMIKYGKYFHPLLNTGLSFVVGGGIGNMIDRTLNGFVVDFIDFTLIDFAVFNVADSFICIGVGLMALDIILGKSNIPFLDDKKNEKEAENDSDC